MSEEELQGKSIILADWLKETFCGRNRHFENGAEDWNPVGLAEFILSVAPEIAAVDQIRTEEDAAKVIEEACSLFVQQISTASKIAFDSGIQIKNFNELTPPIRTLIETWSLLLVGAPECMP